jgi:phosphatidylinositol alpha-mannosyltransferase
MGHEAVVLAPVDAMFEAPGLPSESIVAVGRSFAVPANGSIAPVALSPAASYRAVEAVRRGGFHILHLHEPLAPGPTYACLLATPPSKVGTFHRSGSSAAYRVLGPLARWVAGRLTVRCAVSAEARATAFDALGGTYEVIGNGIDMDRFATAVPWPTRAPTIFFVGRHERRKGLDVLLAAVRRVDEATPLVVWVAGEGPDSAALRRMYPPSERVEWLGVIDDHELARRMSGAHILCAPSLRAESFGVVLLEAMAARAAVVASDLPGYAAVVGNRGTLVPPGDAGTLSVVLAGVVSEAAGGVGRCAPESLDAAYAHAAQWSMVRIGERYLEVYGRAMSSGRPRS